MTGPPPPTRRVPQSARRAWALVRRALGAVRRRAQAEGTVDGVMLGLGATTGLLTGVLAWLLISIVEVLQHVVWTDPAPAWQLVLVPAVGGLLVGLLVTRVVPEVAGGGIVSTMETLALHGGRFRRRVPLGALGATSVALGSGASGGREGPIVLIGGSVGSVVGRLLPIGEARMRSLVAAGAAAGIGASFNAPIGGMLFAIEVLQLGVRGAGLQVVVVGSVVGSVVARQLVGEDLIFQPTREFGLGDPIELVVYALLGLLAVVVALGFHRGEQLAQRAAAWSRRRIGRVATLGAAGLVVGLIALVVPEVLGDGESVPPIVGVREPIQAILDVEYGTTWTAAALLLVLLVAKLVATSVTVGAGSAVGSFAPMLLTGAALGGVVGTAALPILPALDPGAVATVGMAAVFGATARAPLTAIIIVFELVGDYELVLPLMLAVGLAVFLHDRVRPEGIYAAHLRRRGVVLGRPDDVDVLQRVTVAEVMTRDHPTIPADADRAAVEAHFARGGGRGYAVVDPRGQLVGILTRGDLATRDGRTAADLCTRRALTVVTDDPVFVAVRRMASLDVGRVPVLDQSTRRMVGMLRREDIVRAYQLGLTRGAATQQREAASQLRDLTGVRFVELAVDDRSPVVGAAVRDVAWPERTVLTSVRRDQGVVVPTGETVLASGDVLVVLAADPDAVRDLIAGAPADR